MLAVWKKLDRRLFSKNVGSMEEAGQEIIQYLYENLIDYETQNKSCALIRLFKTHSYKDLTPELQTSARQLLGHSDIPPSLKCLTLLATSGERPEWNSRHESRGHQAIPLANENAIASIPMVSQLINQLGLDPGVVLQPDPFLIFDLEQQMYNIFHISDALGSPYIPAQVEFVIPFKIKSVVGFGGLLPSGNMFAVISFGGLLPSGNMFAVIMFLKVAIPRTTFNLIRPLALSVKTAILPFDGGNIFADCQQPTTVSDRKIEGLYSQIATLTQLLEVSEQATFIQSDHLEQAIADLQQALSQLQITQAQTTSSQSTSNNPSPDNSK